MQHNLKIGLITVNDNISVHKHLKYPRRNYACISIGFDLATVRDWLMNINCLWWRSLDNRPIEGRMANEYYAMSSCRAESILTEENKTHVSLSCKRELSHTLNRVDFVSEKVN